MKKALLACFMLAALISCDQTRKKTGDEHTPGPDAEITEESIPCPDTITIASWNLKNFGETKLGDPVRMNIIIDVLTLYDIIAIQEVQDADLSLPEDLVSMINSRGFNYNVVASRQVGRGIRKEQYLFLYDDDIIDTVGGSTGFGIEPGDEFAREPFYCMFRAGHFDFYLLTIHTDPDDVAVEIPALEVAYEALQSSTSSEDDIILLGDFNAKPPHSALHSYIDMSSLAQLPYIYFAIDGATNTRGGRAYDNIIFQQNFTTEFLNSGINLFEDLFNISNDEAFSVSDHLPVWAKFFVGEDDD